MAAVIWLSAVVAAVVATWVIRFGNTRLAQPLLCGGWSWPAAVPGSAACPAAPCAAGPAGQEQGGGSSHVSVMCSLQPSQNSPRLAAHRASGSYGEAIRV